MVQDPKQLIFLISAPRSGSTLLQSLLSNNPQVATVNESWLLLHFGGLYHPNLYSASFDFMQASEATTAFLAATGQQEHYRENLKMLIRQTLEGIDPRPEISHVLDKTPRYYEVIPFIRNLFPEAKIILLKRNPLSVLTSIIDTWQIRTIPQLYSYRRDLLLAPKLIQQQATVKDDANTIALKYEDLITKPEIEIKKLYQWLGIAFEKKVLDFSNNTKHVGLNGDKSKLIDLGVVVQNPERWQQKLEEKTWANFLKGYLDYLGPAFLNEYGYPMPVKGKKTVAFETYRYINEREVASQTPVGNVFTYLFYRSLYRLYTRF